MSLIVFSMQPVYKDHWVKIIGSLLASLTVDSIGRPNSIFERLTAGSFYIDILAGFLITLLLWEGIKRLTVWLDKKYVWLEQPLERFLLQFVLGVVFPVLLSFGITLIYMRLLWDQDIFVTEWLYTEMYMVIFILLLINFIYFSWWLYLKNMGNMTVVPAYPQLDGTLPDRHESTSIPVTKGGKTILLPPTAVAHIHLLNGYTYLQTFEAAEFVSTDSLDEFLQQLDHDQFFRANRQVIINRKACTSYETIENGKIEVALVPELLQKVVVSQKKAKEFRKWITVRR